MVYQTFGRTNLKISQLGFGCMRLPLIDENEFTSINEPLATKMIYYAIDNGVNYVDTAYGYHSGMSEIFLGKILTEDLSLIHI